MTITRRLVPASGIGLDTTKKIRTIIRYARQGCTNRPFFHIVVSDVSSFEDNPQLIHSPPRWFFQRKAEQFDPIIEQVGSFDPMPNERNEKLLSLNIERIRYWIGQGADVSRPVAQVLGKTRRFKSSQSYL